MAGLTLGGGQEVDLGRGMHRALEGQEVWRERHGQLSVEQLQTLLLSRQAQDLVLEPLVLLLQGVERLEHLHDCQGGKKSFSIAGWGWGWGVVLQSRMGNTSAPDVVRTWPRYDHCVHKLCNMDTFIKFDVGRLSDDDVADYVNETI